MCQCYIINHSCLWNCYSLTVGVDMLRVRVYRPSVHMRSVRVHRLCVGVHLLRVGVYRISVHMLCVEYVCTVHA